MPFFILFVIIPLSELMVFVAVSDKIGLGTAFLLSLGTAILGGTIVKHQGIQTMMTAQLSLRQGHIPSRELFDGLCLVAAGAMLITPGFITDTIGFALLIPNLRALLMHKLTTSGKFETTYFSSEHSDFNTQQDQNPDVIDVEFEMIDENKEQ